MPSGGGLGPAPGAHVGVLPHRAAGPQGAAAGWPSGAQQSPQRYAESGTHPKGFKTRKYCRTVNTAVYCKQLPNNVPTSPASSLARTRAAAAASRHGSLESRFQAELEHSTTPLPALPPSPSPSARTLCRVRWRQDGRQDGRVAGLGSAAARSLMYHHAGVRSDDQNWRQASPSSSATALAVPDPRVSRYQ